MTALFLTGTDTGVGKTQVSRALLLAGQGLGRKVIGYKPVETGCDLGAPADAISLSLGGPIHNTYAFDEAVGPAVAAQRSGHPIELGVLLDRAKALRAESELLIVEGAGGFLVPLSGTTTMADLARGLELPVLVVVANRLGAQNHSLLTCECIRARGLTIAGIVLNDLEENQDLALSNQEQISLHEKAPIATMPFCRNDLELARAGLAILAKLTNMDFSGATKPTKG